MNNYEKLYKELQDRYNELNERYVVAIKNLVNYKHDREDLLEANWNLSKDKQELTHKLEQADKQISECIKDLALCKNYLVEFRKEYDAMTNHCKTLEACMPKER